METKYVSLEECLTNADVKAYVTESEYFDNYEYFVRVSASSDMNNEEADSREFATLDDAFKFLRENNCLRFELSLCKKIFNQKGEGR